MAIKRPEEILGQKKRIRVLIAGYPGIGKSTLAFAPNPLHIDCDFGIDRVEAESGTVHPAKESR